MQRIRAGSRASALGTSALSLSLVFGAAAGWAQVQSLVVQDESPIETVIVSVEKRAVAVDAQTVPIALTAITPVEIDERHVRGLKDLVAAAPNVTLADAGTVPGYATFIIRGLGVNTTIPSVEPAVGLFVDGIYLGASGGVVLDLFDLDNIEILRGPQGLLFGRNTTGGAVLINTRRPGDVFAVRGRFNYESGPQATAAMSIEGPLSDQFRAKIAGYYTYDDGWFTNQFDGKSAGGGRTYFVRPTVVWTPSAAFDSTLIYERGARRGDGGVGQNPAYQQGFEINRDDDEFDRQDWEAVTLEANWRTSVGVFTNLAGYRSYDESASLDVDAQPFFGFHSQNLFSQHQYSNELRFAGTFFDRLDVTAGLYYFTQSFLYLERRIFFGGATDSTLGARHDDTNYAAFAQADYHLTPAFTLIGGARVTREEKNVRIATFVPTTAGSRCDFDLQTCNFNFPGPAFPGSPGSDSWDHFTPKLGFQWRPNQNAMIYGQWSQGVRSGGYNVRNTSFTVSPGPYGPELQDAFELGVKSDWFERRLRVNAAAFYDTIEDIQRDINQSDPIAGIVQVTRNTADATIQGFELELTGAVTDELVLYGNAGYVDGRYDEVFYDLDGGGIGASDLGLSIPRLSKWSYSIGATYLHPFPGDYLIAMRVDYGYRSRAASTDDNTAYFVPIEMLSANATLTLPDGHWSFSLYGRNLLDKVSEGVKTPLPLSLGGGFFRTLNEGRVIGIEASFIY